MLSGVADGTPRGISMNPKLIRTCLVLAVVGLCLAVTGIGAWYFFGGSSLGAAPIVRLTQPATGLTINSGQGLVVIVDGESAIGLERVDFTVDGQPAYTARAFGVTRFQAAYPWFAGALGDNQISAVGYDRLGTASQPV